MIEIKEKHECCGCSACVQICPKQCISLKSDDEGFLYPVTDTSICVDCGICNKACPIINVAPARQPIKVLAAKNRDKAIVNKSSSGGIFYHVAQKIITEGGVVFGAKFDEQWNVVHDYVDTIDDLSLLMTSKYVQSNIGQSYLIAKNFLNEGTVVLFTGTPCQVAGLHTFLRKTYDNLVTMDFLCHGVPSPMVWKKYLDFEATRYMKSCVHIDQSDNKISYIHNIRFRDKTDGWKKYRFVIEFGTPFSTKKSVISFMHKKNSYMKGFLNDLYLRPSCHSCHFKRFQSLSDITIGDYWAISRIRPDFYDSDGVSMVFCNTIRGINYLCASELAYVETSFQDTLSNNGLHENVPIHSKRGYFFSHINGSADICHLINKCVDPTFFVMIRVYCIKFFRMFIKHAKAKRYQF